MPLLAPSRWCIRQAGGHQLRLCGLPVVMPFSKDLPVNQLSGSSTISCTHSGTGASPCTSNSAWPCCAYGASVPRVVICRHAHIFTMAGWQRSRVAVVLHGMRALRLSSSSCSKVVVPMGGYRLADTVGQPHQPAAATTEPVRCSVGRFRTGGVHVAQERVQGGVVQNGTNYSTQHTNYTIPQHTTSDIPLSYANTPAPHQRWRKAAAGGGCLEQPRPAVS